MARLKRSRPTADEERGEAMMASAGAKTPGQESGEATVGGRPDGGGGGRGEAAVAAERPGGEITVKVDPHVLVCTICLEPLRPPIFQTCEVGHVVCFICHGKLSDKCHICSRKTTFTRCFALEQFIDAVKVPCSNEKYGCNEFIAYYQKEKHENTCRHAPCFCPEQGCSFRGSTGLLLNHFVTEHGWSPTNIHYNKPLKISLPQHSRFTLFVGEDQSMFLLVNTFAGIGNALTMVCIRPHESGSSYSSKVSAVHRVEGNKGRYVFQMDPHVTSSTLLDEFRFGKFFLLVPPELVDASTGEITINIRIDKI
ncbi:hypothetical protein ACP70R_030356 [Stipagrostis hirtigluma subsp. patula]